MTSDLPKALAGVLTALDREQVGYLVYHQRKSKRIVIFVEGRNDAATVEATLRDAGAETGEAPSRNFMFRIDGDKNSFYVVEVKTAAGKGSIANLLWLAAIDEGAAAARDSLDHAS
jgi:hypothetical protein